MAEVGSWMKSNGLRLHHVAGRIGCSEANLSRVLRGKIGVTASMELKLAALRPVEEVTSESLLLALRATSAEDRKIILQIMQNLQSLREVAKPT